jgi:hypothetical protein
MKWIHTEKKVTLPVFNRMFDLRQGRVPEAFGKAATSKVERLPCHTYKTTNKEAGNFPMT